MVVMIKNPPASAGDPPDAGWIPWWGRSLPGGNVNLLQCSCLENPMHRGAWRATVHGVTKSQTCMSTYKETHTHTHTPIMKHATMLVSVVPCTHTHTHPIMKHVSECCSMYTHTHTHTHNHEACYYVSECCSMLSGNI